jgi:hypothetical protein
MTQQEAITVIETWIHDHSRFAARVVEALPEEQGAWLVRAECSEVIWEQQVRMDGTVDTPRIID